MEIRQYFDFLADDDIRIAGTRVGIESVLYEYIYRSQTPEQIAERFASVTLEEVYATILFYLRNRQLIESYLTKWFAHYEEMRNQQEAQPPPVIVRLRKMAVKTMAA